MICMKSYKIWFTSIQTFFTPRWLAECWPWMHKNVQEHCVNDIAWYTSSYLNTVYFLKKNVCILYSIYIHIYIWTHCAPGTLDEHRQRLAPDATSFVSLVSSAARGQAWQVAMVLFQEGIFFGWRLRGWFVGCNQEIFGADVTEFCGKTACGKATFVTASI